MSLGLLQDANGLFYEESELFYDESERWIEGLRSSAGANVQFDVHGHNKLFSLRKGLKYISVGDTDTS